MNEIVVAAVLILLSALLLFLGIRSFREKGPLLNNAWLYASQKERETMNRKPHYRQSAVVFLLLGIVFLLYALAVFFRSSWLSAFAGAVILIAAVYAVGSSIAIEKQHGEHQPASQCTEQGENE